MSSSSRRYYIYISSSFLIIVLNVIKIFIKFKTTVNYIKNHLNHMSEQFPPPQHPASFAFLPFPPFLSPFPFASSLSFLGPLAAYFPASTCLCNELNFSSAIFNFLSYSSFSKDFSWSPFESFCFWTSITIGLIFVKN